MNLKTDRILLRKIISSDIDDVFRGLSHPDVIKHYGVNYKSLEETKEQMEWFFEPKQQWFAICSIDNQTFFGA
ncbi:GNAT family N-acetyltransferase, partial [Aquimarina litoralis]|uniref:GNAT family N-acetyltransferase n=1 Tax=Aquimarina litoralis TaxID=584605 RepID=UPI001C59FC1E|nr:N-acetyltransferase [Aquimarina litoralis]